MRVDRVDHNLPVQRLRLRRRGHHAALYRAEARHPWRVAAQPRRPEQNRRDFVRHDIFREYLLPGGHLEAEDGSLMDAALRELREETGTTSPRTTPRANPRTSTRTCATCSGRRAPSR
ncbi:NUDIX domain-containing protein [Streptomyces griseoluteus]|uniref:NUDIX domain-containing protein n=1 Tax=Streptomyces griseoluteus TaxID=29306 RepID=UPI0038253974